jgi:hypothetical protein
MVGSSHEGLHRICQADPAGFWRTLQRVLDAPIPEPHDFVVLNADLTEVGPGEPVRQGDRGDGREQGRTGSRSSDTSRGHGGCGTSRTGVSGEPGR